LLLSALAACTRAADPVARTVPPVETLTSLAGTAAAPFTIPFFQSSFVFGGKTYTYRMVGSSPFNAPASVTIPTVIIPVKLRFSNGSVFDPAAATRAIQASPIFRTGSYTAGALQYGDALMRSEFWRFVSKRNYHVILGPPVVASTFLADVSSEDGSIGTSSGIKTAFLTSQYFLDALERQLLLTYHVSPASLTIFAVSDMRVLEPSGGCCYNGFHDSFSVMSASGSATFTTVWGFVSSSAPLQMTHVSHEIAEWLNDPFYPSLPNVVPRWIHPVTEVCDGDELEVGDPLVGTQFTVNGYTVQDETFLSWFGHTVPSIGIEGRYDLLGRFTAPATVC